MQSNIQQQQSTSLLPPPHLATCSAGLWEGPDLCGSHYLQETMPWSKRPAEEGSCHTVTLFLSTRVCSNTHIFLNKTFSKQNGLKIFTSSKYINYKSVKVQVKWESKPKTQAMNILWKGKTWAWTMGLEAVYPALTCGVQPIKQGRTDDTLGESCWFSERRLPSKLHPSSNKPLICHRKAESGK